MRRVRVAELRDKLSSYLRAAEAGEEIEVLDRNRPIARIVPIDQDQLEITPPKRPFAAVRDRRPPPSKVGFDIVDVLLEDRRKR